MVCVNLLNAVTLKLRPVLVIPIGLALFIVGNWLWIGPNTPPATLAEFSEAVAEVGNGYRLGLLFNVLMIVPGFALTLLGIAAILRRRKPDTRWIKNVTAAMTGLAVLSVITELVATGLRLLLVGTVDLESPGASALVAPPNWLFNLEAVFAAASVFAIGLALLLCVISLVVFGVGAARRRGRPAVGSGEPTARTAA